MIIGKNKSLESSLDQRVRLYALGMTRMISSIPKIRNFVKNRNPDLIYVNLWPLTLVTVFSLVSSFK